jgi:mono/diheme cytochrome c family protein
MRSWLFLAVALAACGKGDKPPPSQGEVGVAQESGPRTRKPSHGSNAGPSEAEQLFIQTCARCHGFDGSGRGEVAEMLEVKPRDYTDAKWQATITDDEIKRIIIEGGAAVGKSKLMPPNPTLKDRPEIVAELVQIIRGFAKRNK